MELLTDRDSERDANHFYSHTPRRGNIPGLFALLMSNSVKSAKRIHVCEAQCVL